MPVTLGLVSSFTAGDILSTLEDEAGHSICGFLLVLEYLLVANVVGNTMLLMLFMPIESSAKMTDLGKSIRTFLLLVFSAARTAASCASMASISLVWPHSNFISTFGLATIGSKKFQFFFYFVLFCFFRTSNMRRISSGPERGRRRSGCNTNGICLTDEAVLIARVTRGSEIAVFVLALDNTVIVIASGALGWRR